MNTLDTEESVLLNRAKQGDSTAFLLLVKPHHESLRAVVHRVLNDPHALDDTMQELYIKAFRGLGKFDGRSSFKTWLFRVAYNAAVDTGRRHRKVVALTDEMTDAVTGSAETDVDRRHDLGAALRKLGPEARAAVLLVDAEGFDYETAAAILRIPRGTLASRLNAARATLRAALGEYTKEVER
jgi:RNA polymerase sigma-70 factor (ECF subfamily)